MTLGAGWSKLGKKTTIGCIGRSSPGTCSTTATPTQPPSSTTSSGKSLAASLHLSRSSSTGGGTPSMAGVLGRVFPLGRAVEELGDRRSSRFSPAPSTLILGPARCNKSALLVQAAVSEAAADGQVLFMAPQKLQRLPPGVHGMPTPSSSALENVRFLYAQNECELTGYLASLHKIPAGDRPSLIVIDDLHFFSHGQNIDAASQLMNAARILSLAQESAEFCSNSPECRVARPCGVLAAWTLGSGALKKDEVVPFARSLCHYVWSVHRKAKNSGGEEYHLVEEEQGRTCTVEYSLRLSPSPHLLLRQVALEERGAQGPK
ncbi:hypothetical protein GWK47_033153 [Chionoecetes opilio]|uniref:ATPase SWSAP1 n=1 Tax=Chionoecetes opilio TaxID=41210 RepID=A0A8J4YSG4_CHIOP|nr:hypothetical protein GWK47_033153 [Chionoecetes opilio]